MMDAQPELPTLEHKWPALVVAPGPAFICFELRGVPRHKARHRSRIVFPKGGKKAFIHNYPDPETESYEKVLAEYAALHMRGRAPTERPVAMLVHAYRPIPESWSKTDQAKALQQAILPTSKPDSDNYLKLAKDALNKIVYVDDSRVIDARCIKRYSDVPALRVEIREFIESGTELSP